MPHIILQHSKNIKNPEAKVFFTQVHKLLSERLPTQIVSCKSRLIIADEYLVGNADDNTAFAHLEIALLPGRAPELLSNVSKELYKLLKQYLETKNPGISLDFSVEIKELNQSYYKG